MRRQALSLEGFHFLEIKTSPIYGVFILVCVMAVASGLVWAAVLEIDVVVRAPSVIRPFANISTLKNATPGSVRRKAYTNGQRVTAGTVLWKIDTVATEIDWDNTTRQLQRHQGDLEQLVAYASSLEMEKNVVLPQSSEGYQRAEAYLANIRKLQLLNQGKHEKWQQEMGLPSVMTLARRVKELEDDWTLSVLELEQIRAQEKEKVHSEKKALLTTIETLTQRRAELQRLIREAEVRAPISGLVDDVKKFNVDDFLVAGEEIVRIVPNGSEVLKLELKVDTRDIAEVRIGQVVTSLFPGLPPSRYGHVLGTITNVSADSLLVNGELAYFLVEATLAKANVVDRKGRHLSLKPGMNADSRVVVARKTVFNFLLEKLEFIN